MSRLQGATASVAIGALACARVADSDVERIDPNADAAEGNATAVLRPPTVHSCAEAADEVTTTPAPIVDAATLPDLGFRRAASMQRARRSHVSCVLSDGRVLVAGGGHSGRAVDEIELYDPVADTWTIVGSLTFSPRACVPLGSSAALVGAHDAVRFDPGTRTASPLAPPPLWLGLQALTVINDERWFALGATAAGLYDVRSNTWHRAAAPPREPRAPVAVTMADGTVAIANTETGPDPDRSVLRYEPSADRWSVVDRRPLQHVIPERIVALRDNRLLMGGYPREVVSPENRFQPTPFVTLDSRCEVWRSTAWMPRGSSYGSATLMKSGNVLVLGDMHYPTAKSVAVNVTAVYEPSRDAWRIYAPHPSDVGYYTSPRVDVLPDGRVVISGGAPLCGSGCTMRAVSTVYVIDSAP